MENEEELTLHALEQDLVTMRNFKNTILDENKKALEAIFQGLPFSDWTPEQYDTALTDAVQEKLSPRQMQNKVALWAHDIGLGRPTFTSGGRVYLSNGSKFTLDSAYQIAKSYWGRKAP